MRFDVLNILMAIPLNPVKSSWYCKNNVINEFFTLKLVRKEVLHRYAVHMVKWLHIWFIRGGGYLGLN